MTPDPRCRRSAVGPSTPDTLTPDSRDGTSFAAYAARAEKPTGAGIVIIPDVRGLHPYYEELTLPLRRGRRARRRRSTSTPAPPAASRVVRASSTSRTSCSSSPSASTTTSPPPSTSCARREGGEPERLYTVGFCLGGRVSLLQAAAGLGADGVIGFYPWPVGPHRSGLPAPADEAPRFGCPVLTIYGGADAGIPSEARDAFDAALDASGIDHRTVVYEGAPHSFFDRKAADFADASTAAWTEMLAFMQVGRDR